MSDGKIEVKLPQSNSMSAEDIVKLMSVAMKEALTQAIPAAAIGIDAAKTQADTKSRDKTIREAMAKIQRCPVCLLPVSACGGAFAKDKDGNDTGKRAENGMLIPEPSINHIRWYCGPRDESLLAWFQGVIIKNVRFLSDYYNHEIWIPKKSDIPTIINNWEA
jgi:hypothetical protein